MFPFRTSSIFRSRWIALFWAAGICWTAVQVTGGGKSTDAEGNSVTTDVTGAPVSDAQMKKAEDILRKLGG